MENVAVLAENIANKIKHGNKSRRVLASYNFRNVYFMDEMLDMHEQVIVMSFDTPTQLLNVTDIEGHIDGHQVLKNQPSKTPRLMFQNLMIFNVIIC